MTVTDPAVRRFPYSAIVDRPVPTLPGGARLALWVVTNVEHYEFQPLPNPLRDPWVQRPHPDVVNYARRDYGNRAGVWRMAELLDRLGIDATVSLNSAVLEHFPEIAELLAATRWDVMSHGVYNTRYAAGLDVDGERAMIRDAVDTVRARIGRPVSGWLGPALTTTVDTPDLIAEAGVRYMADYLHDDEPTWVRTTSGPIVSLPYSIHLNDSPLIGRLQHSGRTFARLITDQFDALYAESTARPKILSVCLHPYAISSPSRHRPLEEALGYVLGHEGVIASTGLELAEHFAATEGERP
jgi:allantoinase